MGQLRASCSTCARACSVATRSRTACPTTGPRTSSRTERAQSGSPPARGSTGFATNGSPVFSGGGGPAREPAGRHRPGWAGALAGGNRSGAVPLAGSAVGGPGPAVRSGGESTAADPVAGHLTSTGTAPSGSQHRGGADAADQDGVFTVYTTKDGLLHNAVRGIVEDARGDLWMGTRGGLNRLSNGKFSGYTNAGRPGPRRHRGAGPGQRRHLVDRHPARGQPTEETGGSRTSPPTRACCPTT